MRLTGRFYQRCENIPVPLADAGMTSIQVSKQGYEDPAGLPALFSPYAVPGVSDGWRDVKINGDTRLDIQLVRR
jgi:hypothetical protein